MATILEVADEAGVSAMTVSRYFNQPDLLRPATQERVREAVEALQYVPNHAARSLVRGETKTVALILADVTNPYFTRIARGAEDAAQQAGYTLILGNTDETLDKEHQYVDALISRQVDGVLLVPHDGEHHVEALQQRDIPIVLIDRKVSDAGADTFTTDSYDGGRRLVEHLVERGYRDIGFIGGQADLSSLEERLRGYRTAMHEAGLTPSVHLGRYSRQSGENIMERLIREQIVPEALIAANNFVAVGALVTLRRHGLHIPEDVGLTCFGDLELAALIDPFLTVIAQPAYELGRQAMVLLLERIKGLSDPPREEILPVELIVRRSA